MRPEYMPVESAVGSLSNDLLISIHPEHATRLYSGEKRFELRKLRPKGIPRRLFLYEANAAKSITGHAIIERLLVGAPARLWEDIGSDAAPKSRFFAYFQGRQLGYAFEVRCAVRWKVPVDPTSVASCQGFKPSQNFLYLSNLPDLHAHLRGTLLENAFSVEHEGLSLRPISQELRQRFIEEVDRHISDSYLETGPAYGERLLHIADLGEDIEGVFTTRKFVFEIVCGGRVLGFLVLTEKLGGALKTGPTVLFEEFTGRGVGQRLRTLIHEVACRAGFRKIYCTVPWPKERAIRYLIATGYRLEAQLRRHYHTEHDEFVFGDLVSRYRGPSCEFVRPVVPFRSFSRLSAYSNEVRDFLWMEFCATYCETEQSWADRQVRAAARFAKGKAGEEKPRLIYTSGLPVLCLGLCVVKRGGSVKLLLLTRTSHRRSLEDFIARVESSLRQLSRVTVRKVYAHVPLGDTDVGEALFNSGFRPEGVLQQPYNDHTDMLVMAKALKD